MNEKNVTAMGIVHAVQTGGGGSLRRWHLCGDSGGKESAVGGRGIQGVEHVRRGTAPAKRKNQEQPGKVEEQR